MARIFETKSCHAGTVCKQTGIEWRTKSARGVLRRAYARLFILLRGGFSFVSGFIPQMAAADVCGCDWAAAYYGHAARAAAVRTFEPCISVYRHARHRQDHLCEDPRARSQLRASGERRSVQRVCAACRGILDGSVLDVTEIDAASNNGVDNIRDLRDETRYTPAQVRKRVFIIDEVHMLSIGAFNALLKTLEEPPEHVLFILATTELHKVPATILSRCQRFDFRRIGAEDISRRLLDVAAGEGIALTEGAARLIARLADGAMRDALSMLDRAAAAGAVDEKTVTAALGVMGQDDGIRLAEHLKTGDLAAAVGLLDEYYNAGRDLASVYDQMLGLIRDALLVKTSKTDVSALISPAYSVKTLQALCDGLASSTLIAWSRIISDSLDHMRTAANRRVEAELCAVRLCSLGADSYDTLGGRVEALEEKLKNGVPVQMVPAAAAQQAGDVPLPPSDDDAPPLPGDEDAPDWAREEDGTAEDTPKQEVTLWSQWQPLLEALTGKINIGAHTNIKLSAKGVLEDNALVILCEDKMTAILAAKEPTISVIRGAGGQAERCTHQGQGARSGRGACCEKKISQSMN